MKKFFIILIIAGTLIWSFLKIALWVAGILLVIYLLYWVFSTLFEDRNRRYQ